METLLGMLFERATIFGHVYAVANPKYTWVGNALPYVLVTIFGGLYVIALLLGARELWRKATRYSVLQAHLEEVHRNVEAATIPETNEPFLDVDGRWYRARFDPETGAYSHKAPCDPPRPESAPTVVTARAAASRMTTRA